LEADSVLIPNEGNTKHLVAAPVDLQTSIDLVVMDTDGYSKVTWYSTSTGWQYSQNVIFINSDHSTTMNRPNLDYIAMNQNGYFYGITGHTKEIVEYTWSSVSYQTFACVGVVNTA
jgi:hypothetical protein